MSLLTGGQITKKMQMDVGLTHEIDETRAALVSSIRVTAPARAVVDMGEKTLRIGTGFDNIVSWAGHLALRIRETGTGKRMWPRTSQRTFVRDGRDRTLGVRASIKCDSFDQFT